MKLPKPRLLPATFLTFLLLAVGVVALWSLLKPAPPKRIVLGTGVDGGAYAEFGKLYAKELAKEGITVELRSTAGTTENLALLARGEVDVAFVQGGVAAAQDQRDKLLSLGSLYFEPIWIVHRDEIAPTRLSQLAGLRIAIGLPGSGSRALALRLLALNGINADNQAFVERDLRGMVQGVSGDEIDVAIAVLSIDAPVFKESLGIPGMRIMKMDSALAYQRRLPEITRIHLPSGTIDLKRGIPDKSLDIIATTTALVTTPSLHPAIHYLLWRAARRIHAEPSLLDDSQRFPTIDLYQEFEVPEHVEHLYKDGSPWLYRYLPFWLANLIYRLWFAGIASFALFLAVTDWIPKLFRYAINLRMWGNYLTSVRVEAEIPKAATPQDRARHLQRVLDLRAKTDALAMPLFLDMSKADLVGRLKVIEDKLRQEQAEPAGDTAPAAKVPPVPPAAS